MKKILYISNYKRGLGGINAQVDLLSQHVRVEGYEAEIFSTKGNPMKRIGVFFKLLWVARRYDVLHVHGCSGWGMLPVIYGVIAGNIWKKKVLVTYHGGGATDYFERHGVFARRWLERADKVIALSGFLEKVFDKYQIPCVVIPNIVELPKIVHTHDWNPKAPKFISVRHLRELYNISCILRAFKRVQEQVPKATLTILGDGDKRAELEEWVKEHKLTGVRFVGQVPNKEMNAYLAKHDVFLSTPRVDNMPVSLLEAMNAGVLVISSNVGGVPYMITHQKTGLLFNGDADALAEQMEWALSHQQESLDMIDAAHEEVNKYSWQNIRKQLLPLYESV